MACEPKEVEALALAGVADAISSMADFVPAGEGANMAAVRRLFDQWVGEKELPKGWALSVQIGGANGPSSPVAVWPTSASSQGGLLRGGDGALSASVSPEKQGDRQKPAVPAIAAATKPVTAEPSPRTQRSGSLMVYGGEVPVEMTSFSIEGEEEEEDAVGRRLSTHSTTDPTLLASIQEKEIGVVRQRKVLLLVVFIELLVGLVWAVAMVRFVADVEDGEGRDAEGNLDVSFQAAVTNFVVTGWTIIPQMALVSLAVMPLNRGPHSRWSGVVFFSVLSFLGAISRLFAVIAVYGVRLLARDDFDEDDPNIARRFFVIAVAWVLFCVAVVQLTVALILRETANAGNRLKWKRLMAPSKSIDSLGVRKRIRADLWGRTAILGSIVMLTLGVTAFMANSELRRTITVNSDSGVVPVGQAVDDLAVTPVRTLPYPAAYMSRY